MSEQLLASLKHSQHKVITSATDEHTGKKYELLAVHLEREAVEALIGELQQLTPLRARVAELEADNKTLQECASALEASRTRLSARVAELEAQNAALRHDLARAKSQVDWRVASGIMPNPNRPG